jgi:4-amino-4-deoxy-L-arabinose transferase-like glycosyltransferase
LLRAGLLLLVLIAFALRVAGLDRLGLAYDEAATALMARATPVAIVAFHWDAAFEHPPVWVLLMHGWSALAGQSEFALRLLPALAGTLLIPATWRVARALMPAAHGPDLIAALLVATAPVLVYYSQEARMYTLVVLLVVLTTLLSRRLTMDRYAAPLFIVATWCMLGLHYYSALATALQGVVLLVDTALTAPRPARVWLSLSIAFGLAAAPLLAWMLLAPGFRETLRVVVGAAATSPLGWRAFFDDLWRELSFGSIRWLPPQAVWGYALLPLAAAGAVAAPLSTRGEPRRIAWLAAALAIFPLLSATALLRTLSVRYILYCVPFLYLLAAWTIVRLGRVHWAAGWLALAATLMIAGLGVSHYLRPYVKSDYRAMAAELAARVDPATDLVVLEGPRQHLLAKYYFPPTWTLATVPEVDLPDYWPVTAPPVTPEVEDGRFQTWLARHPAIWIIYAGEGEVDRGEFLAKYSAAVAYLQDCDRWLDVRVCRYVSPRFVTPVVVQATDLAYGDLAVTGIALSLHTPPVAPASLLIRLDWVALARPAADVKASLRLVSADAAVIAQTDELPIGPLLPPTTWSAGDRKPGYFSLTLPSKLAEADYRIELSVYDAATLAAIAPLTAAGAPQREPHIAAVLHVAAAGDTMLLLPAQ